VFERMLGSVILQQFTASIANARVNCPYISGCLWWTSAAVWWQTSAQAAKKNHI